MLSRRELFKRLAAAGLAAATVAIPDELLAEKRFFSLDQTMIPQPAVSRVDVLVHYPERPVEWDTAYDSRLLGGIQPLWKPECNTLATILPLSFWPEKAPVRWNPEPTIVARGDPRWSADAELYDALRYDVPR
jgi:hypothetical protein